VNHSGSTIVYVNIYSGPAAGCFLYVYVNTYMTTLKHKEYTDYIINSVRVINPHSAAEGRIAYVYASGFLASYLANILSEDPIALKEFERHIKHLQDKP
jgi:hypothetical protein